MSLPIKKSAAHSLLKSKRSSKTYANGLGDFVDLHWKSSVPLLLDTGSADLWSVSTDCTQSSCGNISGFPLIETQTFKPTEIDFTLDYGDTFTVTFVTGLIVSGPVTLVGIELDNQFFGAGSFTNSHVIFDVRRESLELDSMGLFYLDWSPQANWSNQCSRVNIGGNVSQLTIGTLPDGVRNDSLTWVPVQRSSLDNAGIAGPSDSPDEESFLAIRISWVTLRLAVYEQIIKPASGKPFRCGLGKVADDVNSSIVIIALYYLGLSMLHPTALLGSLNKNNYFALGYLLVMLKVGHTMI
ncbi:hypothetical protein M422DRAFT_254748 [Sphaerobolus stellatus SS14]|uniref:Peptidase A1 domain-containing protein n=1 Tax=Sphaerobolus stellatus (strain SS14) TaxID=990650 RepID=A0A0C9VK80_SPHS4|nr:hypothetical protein M422DRAFT_254748 [Sphaerobolus stellatus SS14]